jgi:hypothetical protein
MADSVSAGDEVLTAIAKWFDQVRLAGLELPTGWFGRPFDNLHQLTWSASATRKVLLELDEQILVVLTQPERVEVIDNDLHVVGSKQVVVDWQEYGRSKSRVDDCGSGDVVFHGQARP